MRERRTTYNAGNGSDEDLFRDLIGLLNRGPIFVGLEEVADRIDVLEEVAMVTGYRLVVVGGAPSSKHNAAFLHPQAVFERAKLVTLSWRSYVGKRTAGSRRTGYAQAKHILVVYYRWRGRKHVDGVTHLVPSAGVKGNRLTRILHGVQVARCALWLRTRRRRATLMGDLNGQPGTLLLKALGRVAVLFAVASHGRRAIDVFAVPRRQAKGRRFTVTALDGFSSDHKPVELDEDC